MRPAVQLKQAATFALHVRTHVTLSAASNPQFTSCCYITRQLVRIEIICFSSARVASEACTFLSSDVFISASQNRSIDVYTRSKTSKRNYFIRVTFFIGVNSLISLLAN
jgi:hypothetical protein